MLLFNTQVNVVDPPSHIMMSSGSLIAVIIAVHNSGYHIAFLRIQVHTIKALDNYALGIQLHADVIYTMHGLQQAAYDGLGRPYSYTYVGKFICYTI